jgi:hypothetical protein
MMQVECDIVKFGARGTVFSQPLWPTLLASIPLNIGYGP